MTAATSTTMTDGPAVLLLPGRGGGDPTHWLRHWAAPVGPWSVVEQSDWERPRRGDWLARLEDVVRDHAGPLVLVAEGLACHLVAAWAIHSSQVNKIRAAMLVAPSDLAGDRDMPAASAWRDPALQRLPFVSALVTAPAAGDADAVLARRLSEAWGSVLVAVPATGDVPCADGRPARALAGVLQRLLARTSA